MPQPLETRGSIIPTEFEETFRNRTAGVPVNDRTALSVPFIYRGVDLLSSKIASLSRVISKNKTKLPQHPASKLLNQKCNNLYSCHTAIKTIVGHAVLLGNGYGVLYRDASGAPTEMYVINPRMTYLRFMDGKWVYQITVYKNDRGEVWSQPWIPSPEMAIGYYAYLEYIPAEDMFHLKGLGDGLTGYSLLSLLSQAIGEQVALQEYSNSFFANGCQVGQALEIPPSAGINWKDESQVERYRRMVEGKHQGPQNAFRLFLALGGAQMAGRVGLTAQEAQVIEQREFGLKLISAILGIPSYLLDGSPEGASQYGTQEARSRDFLSYTVANWLDSFAAEAEAKLLTEEEKDSGDFSLCWDREKLIELDITTSRKVLWGDVAAGLKTQDEAREELGLDPLPKPEPPPMAPPLPPALPPEPSAVKPASTAPQASQPPQNYRDATIDRLVRRMAKSVERRKDLSSWLASSWEECHRAVLVEALSPYTPDADVLVDDLLPNLAEELQATTRDKYDSIFERVKNDIAISVG